MLEKNSSNKAIGKLTHKVVCSLKAVVGYRELV
jgi:hypothetical protein